MARHPQWIIDTEQRTHPAISIDLKFRHLAEKLAFLQHRTLIDKWTTSPLFVQVKCVIVNERIGHLLSTDQLLVRFRFGDNYPLVLLQGVCVPIRLNILMESGALLNKKGSRFLVELTWD